MRCQYPWHCSLTHTSPLTPPPPLQASLHLITGHKNGGLIMWDTSYDVLKPVLRTRGQRSPVRGLAICEQLMLLAAGHVNGKVLLRKLDPRLRLSPSREAGDTIWEPSKGELLCTTLCTTLCLPDYILCGVLLGRGLLDTVSHHHAA